MIKWLIEFLLWPLAWLWRRHERDVLCTGIEGQGNLNVDALNRLAGDMKDRMEQITDRLVKEFEERHQDKISMIVITRLASPGSVLVCRYDGKRYALISLEDWMKAKGSIVEPEPPPYKMGFIPLVGIPVVEDEDLAARILMANVSAGEPTYRWN